MLFVRTAEVLQVLDDQGRAIGDHTSYFDGHRRGSSRKIQLKLDANSYKEDSEGKRNVYDAVNLIMRRSGRENNFKPVLDSIRNLCLSDASLASTLLHEVFLGYRGPSRCHA